MFRRLCNPPRRSGQSKPSRRAPEPQLCPIITRRAETESERVGERDESGDWLREDGGQGSVTRRNPRWFKGALISPALSRTASGNVRRNKTIARRLLYSVPAYECHIICYTCRTFIENTRSLSYCFLFVIHPFYLIYFIFGYF